MKLFITTSVLYLLFCRSAGAESSPAALSSIPSDIQEARNWVEKGEYTKALENYEKFLDQISEDNSLFNEIRNEYEDLNLKLIFSRFITHGSFFHAVMKGDNLYNLAQKYKTTIALIKRSNGLKGDVLYPGMKLKIQTNEFIALVNKHDNTLKLLQGDKVLKRYRVGTGENNSTPTGDFRIVTKLENPIWYHAGAVIPAGSSENVLGTRWLGFDHKGYGIHGTTMPESIGKQMSSGCIRMLNQDVEELYDILPAGTKVTIVE